MHWNNGAFHGPLTIKNYLYVTENKHVAIYGNENHTIYGDENIPTKLLGKILIIKACDDSGKINIISNGDHGAVYISGEQNITNTSTNGQITFNAHTAFTAEADDGYVTITANGNDINNSKATFKSTNGGVDILAKSDILIESTTGGITINAINANNNSSKLSIGSTININTKGSFVAESESFNMVVNGDATFKSVNGETNIIGGTEGLSLRSSKYIKLNSASGLVTNTQAYGTSLPDTGINGQIFFKLIS